MSHNIECTLCTNNCVERETRCDELCEKFLKEKISLKEIFKDKNCDVYVFDNVQLC